MSCFHSTCNYFTELFLIPLVNSSWKMFRDIDPPFDEILSFNLTNRFSTICSLFISEPKFRRNELHMISAIKNLTWFRRFWDKWGSFNTMLKYVSLRNARIYLLVTVNKWLHSIKLCAYIACMPWKYHWIFRHLSVYAFVSALFRCIV